MSMSMSSRLAIAARSRLPSLTLHTPASTRYTSAAIGSPFDIKNPEAAARARASREAWIARLKAEHGDGWRAIVEEHDERSERNERRIQEEHKRQRAIREMEKKKAKQNASQPSRRDPTFRTPNDHWDTPRRPAALNTARPKHGGPAPGKKPEKRPVRSPAAVRDWRPQEEHLAMKAAKAEAERIARAAKGKAEHKGGR